MIDLKAFGDSMGLSNLPKEAINILSGVFVGVVGFGDSIMAAGQNAAVMEVIKFGVTFMQNQLKLGSTWMYIEQLAPAAIYAYASTMGFQFITSRGRGFLPNFLAALGSQQLGNALAGEAGLVTGIDTSPSAFAPYGDRTA